MPDVAAIFDREADNWDAGHGPDSPRASEFRMRADYLRALCDRLGRPRVLDLGCGTGWQLLDLAGSIDRGTGIDLSPGMIARARQNAAALDSDTTFDFRVGDIASALPDTVGPFELILFVGSLEHAPDPAAQLDAAVRLLDREGRLVVIMPHPWNLGVFRARWSPSARQGAPFRHMTPRHLARVASRSGLRLESVTALPYRAAPQSKAGLAHRSPIIAGAYAASFGKALS
ncbi:MAG: methyltransferase domain-containing protein [Alphaproteobacteria bacterium]|nr:methyltransferase domain-containing protein [Alphaproteobacteria bacterium]